MSQLPAGITPPLIVRCQVPQPALGQDWRFVIPADNSHTLQTLVNGVNGPVLSGPMWIKPVTGVATFATSSAAGFRYPGSGVWDQNGVNIGQMQQQFPRFSPSYTIPICYGNGHSWQVGGGTIASQTGCVEYCWTNIPMPPGFQFGSATGLIQAGDGFTTGVQLVLAVWLGLAGPYLDAFGPMWRAR